MLSLIDYADGSVFLGFAGLTAGFVDAIAGGGGLIALPSISLILGTGPLAIGTNKIASFTAAAVALLVYMRHGHVDWRKSASFTLATAGGAVVGSRISPLLSPKVFPWLLVITCPIILYIVWRKDLWVAHEQRENFSSIGTPWWQPAILLSGLGCGFYDGLWGPGGGTFEFLSLLFFARMPLLSALAAAKFANTASAMTSLASYAMQGYVQPRAGILVAVGAVLGGFLGARQATAWASKIVRPVLAIVAVLLVIRLLSDSGL